MTRQAAFAQTAANARRAALSANIPNSRQSAPRPETAAALRKNDDANFLSPQTDSDAEDNPESLKANFRGRAGRSVHPTPKGSSLAAGLAAEPLHWRTVYPQEL